MSDKTIYIQCDCHSHEHLLVAELMEWRNGQKDFYFSYQLTPYMPLWRRLYHAAKYVLGVERFYAHWDCVCVSKESAKTLGEALIDYAAD